MQIIGSCFSARFAGYTHDSTAFQASKLYELIIGEASRLPVWACVAADNAFENRSRVLISYSGNSLSQKQDSFNYFLSSCRIVVEQCFGMLFGKFGIFWSPLRHPVQKCTLIIAACSLHNLIIERSGIKAYDIEEEGDMNGTLNIDSEPVVHVQDLLHMEFDLVRGRHQQESDLRGDISSRLNELGYVRTR